MLIKFINCVFFLQHSDRKYNKIERKHSREFIVLKFALANAVGRDSPANQSK
jgi:hypothetical protein